jgi:hypothetical protein
MNRFLLATTFVVLGAMGAQAQDAAIRQTITEQLEAFRADDFARAFNFASPSLQDYFQTPERFGRMVTRGYPMVRRPKDVDYLEMRNEAGTYWQKVQITDADGRLHVLEYRMEEIPDGWRINGVRILDTFGVTV